MNSIYPLFSLILPFLLWPVEFLIPFPFIVEELAKAWLIASIKPWERKNTLFTPLIIGITFAVSETVLYAFNLIAIGRIDLLVERLVLTGILHTTTTLIIFVFARYNAKLMPIGIVVSILIHYFYNHSIIGW